jgi:Family of unknown function (DUF5947)
MSAGRLQALAQRSAATREDALERCEMCGAPIGADHRHLLELPGRELRCTCRPCALLFDRPVAAGGRLRLVPDRRLRLDDLALDDVMWEELRLPVDIAFFFRNSSEGRVQAFYPSPMGPTESLLGLGAWERLEAGNPVLQEMQPDVEALLVDRARGARRHWLVPIDECYALVGLIRTRWRGLTGGKEVWQGLAEFFDDLDRRSRPVAGRETTWRG